MGMRIWYQNATQLGQLTNHAAALRERAKEVCSEGVEVVFNGVGEARYEGRMPAEILRYPYAKMVLQTEMVDFVRRAEAEGFDAVILGSFSEPLLTECRSMVDIPVVSMAEAALLVACSMAEQFSLVTLAPANARRLKALVKRHGLESRVLSVHGLKRPVDEADLNAAYLDPKPVAEDFAEIAKHCIASGADAVMPAEGLLTLVVHRSGLRQIDGATILEPMSLALLYAEMIVTLKRRTGQTVGRRWNYAMPPDDLKAQLDRHRG